jgi:hypothetical protein
VSSSGYLTQLKQCRYGKNRLRVWERENRVLRGGIGREGREGRKGRHREEGEVQKIT